MRRTVGFFLAPAVFLALLALPLRGALSRGPSPRRPCMAAVVVLWVTEALPLPVTALLGAAACVVLEVAPAKEVFAPFADPLMFLFIGAFILARAIFLHGLDRRVAYARAVAAAGSAPGRHAILFAFGAVTAAHLRLDLQHRHHGDDVRHRDLDPRRPPTAQTSAAARSTRATPRR